MSTFFQCLPTRHPEEPHYNLIRLHAHDPVDKTVAYEKQMTDYDQKFAQDIANGKYASFAEMSKAYSTNDPTPPPPPGE